MEWVAVGSVKPTQGEELKHKKLAKALMTRFAQPESQGSARKTKFTQQEWDRFDVVGLREFHFVRSGDMYFKPATRADCEDSKTEAWLYKEEPISVIQSTDGEVSSDNAEAIAGVLEQWTFREMVAAREVGDLAGCVWGRVMDEKVSGSTLRG